VETAKNGAGRGFIASPGKEENEMTQTRTKKPADYSNSAENLSNPPEIGEKLKELHKTELRIVELEAWLGGECPEYMELKETEQKVAELTAQIKDMIDAQGSYQDTDLGWYAVKYRRVSKSYEAEPFMKFYPQYVPAVIVNAVNSDALGGLIKGGLITEDELRKNGVLKEDIKFAYHVKVE